MKKNTYSPYTHSSSSISLTPSANEGGYRMVKLLGYENSQPLMGSNVGLLRRVKLTPGNVVYVYSDVLYHFVTRWLLQMGRFVLPRPSSLKSQALNQYAFSLSNSS
ncbi:hypothetical protein LguiB_033342 [Lonicera macranthoides]